MSSQFWAGKKVFLTGHTGFKGAWMSLWLTKLGATVCGQALEPTEAEGAFNSFGLDDHMQSIIHDIRDLETLKKNMSDFQPDIVFHLAAQPLVRYSYDNPVETYETNVIGTVNVLESIRNCSSVKSAVIITTDKCYENLEWEYGYREVDRLGGYDPYSNSKACAELVTSSYRNSFFPVSKYSEHGVAIASARAGNVIGGGDWAQDRLVPDIVRAMTSDSTLEIRNPASTRPWQHVLEPVRGYMILGQKLYESGPEVGDAFNFGPGDEDCQPVKYLVNQALKFWDSDNVQMGVPGVQPHEANFLKLDSSRAMNVLKWQPVWNIESALTNTFSWYQQQKDEANRDLFNYSLGQIEKFESDSLV